jgi:nucleoside phosphorylase
MGSRTQHRATIRWLHDEYGTLCEEMESQAIASTCKIFGVPFMAVKDIR